MLDGTISYGPSTWGGFYLKVEYLPDRLYCGYSMREAQKRYRDEFGLRYRKIEWQDCRR